ncbi:hypothetical protein, partial [Bradyrhizobium yuanmingense]|uniref:hypothetical protein n=1 Tax=Bradyrhizobium yuanmingense TaxID=108015 RepID=UPI0023B92891
MAGAAEQLSINPEKLIRSYEDARRAAGIGHREWRLTPGQHLDLHRLVAAMRAEGGIAADGAEVDVWVNYLAPILAESGPARRLLQDALQSQIAEPGRRIDDLMSKDGTDSPPEEAGRLTKAWQMLRRISGPAWLALFLAVVVLATVAIVLYPRDPTPPPPP